MKGSEFGNLAPYNVPCRPLLGSTPLKERKRRKKRKKRERKEKEKRQKID